MRAALVIPARYGATRFPGKVLAPIAGKPMIQWVFEGCCRATRVHRVLIATDDERVARACAAFGAQTVMTSPDCESGTARVAEVAGALREDAIVNVQGDEPLISGAAIDAVLERLESDPEIPMATAVHPATPETLDDSNRVKVVLDQRERALYFSRSRIPAVRDIAPSTVPVWQHVGLYAYRRPFLLDFAGWPQTPLERAESLEQLRALERGFPIGVTHLTDWRSQPVDVPADVAAVEHLLRKQHSAATAEPPRRPPPRANP